MTDIICTVDVVLLTLQQQQLHVALLRREREPFKDVLALPGGYIHPQQDADTRDAALRTLRKKTGITSPWLEELGTFSGPGRDPRGWSLSVVWYALVPPELLHDSRKALELLPVAELKGLPFDHQHIVSAAVERVRNKSSYSSLPVYLCGERFTLPQLQAVYEALLGEPVNKVSFRRKMDELGMIEPIDGELETGRANRPAQLYRLKPQFRSRLSLSDRGLNPR